MKITSISIRMFAIAMFLCFLSFPCVANDSASERTPSGLKFKTIRDVSIEREDLRIRKKKIEVSYLFKNNSDRDIVTEVAFPIPEYEYVEDNVVGNPQFEDFLVVVNGVKIKYEIVARALLKGSDITEKLRKKGITIHDFNATNTEKPERRFSSKYAEHNAFVDAQKASILKMLGNDKEEFIRLKIIDKNGQPNWKVSKSYVWIQKFPANSTIKVKHSYTPCYGWDQNYFENNGALESFIKGSCISNENAANIRKNFSTEKNWFLQETVSYILQTANNWKKPIGKFNLHINRENADFMGICFDKKITPVLPDGFEASVTDYVPSKDLKVYWIYKKAK